MNFRRHLAREALKALVAKRKAQHKGRRGRKPSTRVRRPIPPKALERKYRKKLQPYLDAMRALVQIMLLPRLPGIMAHVKLLRGDTILNPIVDRLVAIMHNDGPLEDAEAIFDRMRARLEQSWGDQELADIARELGTDVVSYATDQLRAQLGDALGESPFLAVTPGMDLAAKGFVKDNVRLIQSISEKYFGDIETLVNDAVRSGSSTADLAAALYDDIDGRFDVSESRADLIARDQISKLNGDIAQAQQTDLGIIQYIWRTSLDERVRESHAILEGETFDWDDPPEVGHPGEDFQCRCTAEPIIPDADEADDQ